MQSLKVSYHVNILLNSEKRRKQFCTLLYSDDLDRANKTGVVDLKRWIAQSVSGMGTHTSTCNVYRMCVCKMYMQYDSSDTGPGHIKIVLGSVIRLCQV